MRHGASGRRSRNRNNGGGGRRGNQGRPQVFDSNGPDVRIRGTAHQIHEKYMALAKDAEAVGDRILAESYLQHAEHYQRVINSWGESSDTYGAQAAEKEIDGDDLGLPASLTRSENARQQELADA